MVLAGWLRAADTGSFILVLSLGGLPDWHYTVGILFISPRKVTRENKNKNDAAEEEEKKKSSHAALEKKSYKDYPFIYFFSIKSHCFKKNHIEMFFIYSFSTDHYWHPGRH